MVDYTFLRMITYYAMAMMGAILMESAMRMAMGMVRRAWDRAASSAKRTM